jgi:hypothetical protein
MNKKLTDSEIAELRGIGERHAAPDMLRRHELSIYVHCKSAAEVARALLTPKPEAKPEEGR